MDLQEIYKALRSEYDGKTWSDEFMKIHITLMRDGQIICWFAFDKDDEGFEEKRDCAISFYDEVVRFLVDRFGEEFKYEDPRISNDYIDRNNIHGQYEIVLDDDGENAPVIAIWENEENEMKPRINENKTIIKEGAGAGYTVEIKNLKIGDLIGFEWKSEKNGDGEYVEAKFKVVPGTYEIGASDYYNDFFWQEHELGVTPDAIIDGGVITVEYNPDYYKKDYEDPEFKDYDGRGLDIERELRRQIQGEYDISFSYGHGWTHADLPETMDLTDVDVNGREIYWMITRLQLDAGDLADAVNSGYQITFDDQGEEDEEEIEDGEPMDESYDPKGDDGRKKVMDALEEFRQVLWNDTKVDDKAEHKLRKALFCEVDSAISNAVQKYFKYSRM